MRRVSFTISGKPFAKQRPKFVRSTGRAFTPKETVAFESIVRDIALPHFPTPFEGAVEVSVVAVFEMAASWPAKKKAALMGKRHTQKPDVDNILKAALDGLNRVAFADDSQVSDLRVAKMWGAVAGTTITITTLEDEEDARLAADALI